jgi:hypothetical protein
MMKQIEVDLCGFRVILGADIGVGDLIMAHEPRDLEFNEGRPERVTHVERHTPDDRGGHYHALWLEPLKGGEPRRRWVSVRKPFIVRPV